MNYFAYRNGIKYGLVGCNLDFDFELKSHVYDLKVASLGF